MRPLLDYSSQTLGNIKIHTFPSVKMYRKFESEVSDDENIGIYVRKYLYALIEEPQISENEFLLIDDVEVSSIIRLILNNEPELNGKINEGGENLISSFKEVICLYHKIELEKARDTLNKLTSSIKNDFFPINDILSPVIESINNGIAAVCNNNYYYSDITNALKIIENQQSSLSALTESIKRITDGWQNQLSILVENFAKISNINFDRISDRFNNILSRHMLYLTPRLLEDREFFYSILEIIDMNKYKVNEINQLFFGYYSKNNCENLSIMIKSWRDNDYFIKRMKIFNTSLRFLRMSSDSRAMNPSLLIIPALLPQ